MAVARLPTAAPPQAVLGINNIINPTNQTIVRFFNATFVKNRLTPVRLWAAALPCGIGFCANGRTRQIPVCCYPTILCEDPFLGSSRIIMGMDQSGFGGAIKAGNRPNVIKPDSEGMHKK